jgi:hypothetical protein
MSASDFASDSSETRVFVTTSYTDSGLLRTVSEMGGKLFNPRRGRESIRALALGRGW